MKVKNNGQALVEFVLILPVLLLLLFMMIDFGRLFYQKIQLEDRFETSIATFLETDNYDDAVLVLNHGQDSEATLEVKSLDSYIQFKVSIPFSFFTPGSHLIFGKPYQIRIERTVPYE